MAIDLSTPSAQGEGTAPYPTTASGRRNWSAAAVHGGQGLGATIKQSGHELVPEYEGSFADFLDVINPLQHIPIVSQIYRAATGDTINPAASIIGGTLFGGPVGFLASLGNTLFAQITGQGAGEYLLAGLTGGELISSSETSPAQVASRYDAASRLRM